MESVLSSYTHGHSVLLSEEKLLNSWDRCVVLYTEREGTHLPLPCLRSYLTQRRGQDPVLRGETPSTALITKISQEGETSPEAALNDACAQDLSAEMDGHFISLPHW